MPALCNAAVVVPIPTLPDASTTNGVVSALASLTTKLLPLPVFVIVTGTPDDAENVALPVMAGLAAGAAPTNALPL